MNDDERAELMAALHQPATFAEALLDLNTRLLDALATGENARGHRSHLDAVNLLRVLL